MAGFLRSSHNYYTVVSRASAHAGQKCELCLSTCGHLPGDTIIIVVIILVTVSRECYKYLSCSCVQALQILYAYHPKDPAFTTETCVDELLSCDSASSDCLADDPVDIATTQRSAAFADHSAAHSDGSTGIPEGEEAQGYSIESSLLIYTARQGCEIGRDNARAR